MKSYTLLLFLFGNLSLHAAVFKTDTVPAINHHPQEWITPAALFGAGVMFATVPPLNRFEKNLNTEIKKTGRQTQIDQATQFFPAIAVFASTGRTGSVLLILPEFDENNCLPSFRL